MHVLRSQDVNGNVTLAGHPLFYPAEWTVIVLSLASSNGPLLERIAPFRRFVSPKETLCRSRRMKRIQEFRAPALTFD